MFFNCRDCNFIKISFYFDKEYKKKRDNFLELLFWYKDWVIMDLKWCLYVKILCKSYKKLWVFLKGFNNYVNICKYW